MNRRRFIGLGLAAAGTWPLAGCVTTNSSSPVQDVLRQLSNINDTHNVLVGGRIAGPKYVQESKAAELIFSKYGSSLPKADFSALAAFQKQQIAAWRKARHQIDIELS